MTLRPAEGALLDGEWTVLALAARTGLEAVTPFRGFSEGEEGARGQLLATRGLVLGGGGGGGRPD